MDLAVRLSPEFPVDTVIGAYAFVSDAPDGQPPPVPATDTATVTAFGLAVFTALEFKTSYWLGAQVNGIWRYAALTTRSLDSISEGFAFGTALDTDLYRLTTGYLCTSGSLQADDMLVAHNAVYASETATAGRVVIGAVGPSNKACVLFGAGDVLLYRSAASALTCDNAIGFFGVTPVTTKPAAPATVAEIASILRGYGMCA